LANCPLEVRALPLQQEEIKGESNRKTSNDKFLILWGDEILANMPPCLGGGDNGINVT